MEELLIKVMQTTGILYFVTMFLGFKFEKLKDLCYYVAGLFAIELICYIWLL